MAAPKNVRSVAQAAENVFDSLLNKARNFAEEAEDEFAKLLKRKPKPSPAPERQPIKKPGRPSEVKEQDEEERGKKKRVLTFSDAMKCVVEVLEATALGGPTLPKGGKGKGGAAATSQAMLDWFDDLSDELVFGVNEVKLIERIEKKMEDKLLSQKAKRRRVTKRVNTRNPNGRA